MYSKSLIKIGIVVTEVRNLRDVINNFRKLSKLLQFQQQVLSVLLYCCSGTEEHSSFLRLKMLFHILFVSFVCKGTKVLFHLLNMLLPLQDS